MVPVMMLMLGLERAGFSQAARCGGGQVADGAQEKRGEGHTGCGVAGQMYAATVRMKTFSRKIYSKTQIFAFSVV